MASATKTRLPSAMPDGRRPHCNSCHAMKAGPPSRAQRAVPSVWSSVRATAVGRPEEHQQYEVLGDVVEAVCLVGRHEENGPGPDGNGVAATRQPRASRGDHVDLVLGVRALNVRGARAKTVAADTQVAGREMLHVSRAGGIGLGPPTRLLDDFH